MKGFWAMLTGRGEREYREQHQSFDDSIPDDFPSYFTEEERAECHPAYNSDSSDAMNYRRAHAMRGPQSKREHAEMDAVIAKRNAERRLFRS